jgi:ribonuclease P protein component
MKREQRLTQEKHFAAVYSQGKSWAGEMLVMKASPNQLEATRFGFSVSKRVGKAVARNRIKRRLRECVQSMSWKPGWDVVLIARSTSATADYGALRKGLDRLNRRAKLKG